jgi:hypothetical protein
LSASSNRRQSNQDWPVNFDNPTGAERIAPNPPRSAVGVRRYRIVVTKIHGPAEVYLERLLTLFRASNKWHDKDAIRAYAQ